MPYVRKKMDRMRKDYGAKEGTRIYFATKAAHPEQERKALRTAQSEGKGHVLAHSNVKSSRHTASDHSDRHEIKHADGRRGHMMKTTRKAR